MNPFEADVIRVADPLSAYARSVRKSLLLSSIIAIAVAKTGLIPTQISALGLQFSQADRGSMIWLIGAVVGFLLISFVVAAAADFAAWRMSIFAKSWEEETDGYENLRKSMLEEKRLTDEDREALQEQERRVGAMWRNAGHLDRYSFMQKLVGTISWGRVAIEFVAPVLAGISAIALIACTSP